MKSLIAGLILVTAGSAAIANPHRHWHHGHRHAQHPPVHVIKHRSDWVAPLIIGGVVGAALAHNRAEAQPLPPQMVPQPLYVPTPMIQPYPSSCIVVRETLHPDGVVVRDIQCRDRQ
jgi:hypothetical protein